MATASSTPNGEATRIEDTVIAAEHALYRACIDKDMARLDAVMAPELCYVHSNGVAESKSVYLARVAEDFYVYGRIESRDVSIVVDRELAVMHGRLDMAVATDGRPTDTVDLLFCLVWVLREGAWKLASRHATRIP